MLHKIVAYIQIQGDEVGFIKSLQLFRDAIIAILLFHFMLQRNDKPARAW